MSWICVDHLTTFGICGKGCDAALVLDPYLFEEYVRERRTKTLGANDAFYAAQKEHEQAIKDIDTDFLTKVVASARPREEIFGKRPG